MLVSAVKRLNNPTHQMKPKKTRKLLSGGYRYPALVLLINIFSDSEKNIMCIFLSINVTFDFEFISQGKEKTAVVVAVNTPSSRTPRDPTPSNPTLSSLTPRDPTHSNHTHSNHTPSNHTLHHIPVPVVEALPAANTRKTKGRRNRQKARKSATKRRAERTRKIIINLN